MKIRQKFCYFKVNYISAVAYVLRPVLSVIIRSLFVSIKIHALHRVMVVNATLIANKKCVLCTAYAVAMPAATTTATTQIAMAPTLRRRGGAAGAADADNSDPSSEPED